MTSATSTEEADLAAVGIHIIGDEAPDVRAECMRIARRLFHANVNVIGFIPATKHVGIPAVAIQLCFALVELSGAPAAFVDANVRYPALADLSIGENTEIGDDVFSTRWIRESVALLTPRRTEHPGETVPALANLLLDSASLFPHILVDLTGFDLLGEHASAADCMDGVVLLGRAHQTRENDLLRYVEEMPEGRFLGVLLLG